MRTRFKGAKVFAQGEIKRLDIVVADGRIAELSPAVADVGFDVSIDFSDHLIAPGFVDVHVHLREPGFSMKERMRTGTMAAARAGYVLVCAMPNVEPPPDSLEHLRIQQKIIEAEAAIEVRPYGAITVGRRGAGELVDFAALADQVAGFSDDGCGVQSEDLMREAMRRVRALNQRVCAHCEANELVRGGCVHAGAYASAHRLPGISSESEWRQLERDLRLVREVGCAYHACHVSTKESVSLLRAAKREGLPVTCETAPHYLLLTDEDLRDEGRFKMNPPIRARADQEALLEGALDGTIDVIATDHAPHTRAEKSRGLLGSAMGVAGLETAFPALYTKLVLPGLMTMERLLGMMCDAPREIFGLPGGIRPGAPATLNVVDLARESVVRSDEFLSMGRATPFEGLRVLGDNILTMVNGRIVWSRQPIEKLC